MVAAEDTRRLRRLATDLGIEIPGRVVSYFEGNEHFRTESLLESLLGGHRVVLVTDAGHAERLATRATASSPRRSSGTSPITSVPGPSAVLTALAVSGLPVDRFCFEGFLPRKPGERARRLAALDRGAADAGVLRGAAPHPRDPRRRWPRSSAASVAAPCAAS